MKAKRVINGIAVFTALGERSRMAQVMVDSENNIPARLISGTSYRIIRERGLTQVQAAKLLGVKQPQVSPLIRNRHGNFSIARLIGFLTALDQDVQITVKPTSKDLGALSVAVS
jgi:predicted XRE-type DNA-binding protein